MNSASINHKHPRPLDQVLWDSEKAQIRWLPISSHLQSHVVRDSVLRNLRSVGVVRLKLPFTRAEVVRARKPFPLIGHRYGSSNHRAAQISVLCPLKRKGIVGSKLSNQIFVVILNCHYVTFCFGNEATVPIERKTLTSVPPGVLPRFGETTTSLEWLHQAINLYILAQSGHLMPQQIEPTTWW